MPDQENKVSRRSFLDYLLGGLLAIGGAGFVSGVLSYWYPPKAEKHEVSTLNLGKTDTLPVGTGKKADFNGTPIIVMHMPSGFFAVSAVCTHLGCITDWDAEKQQILCPCHNATFDFKGNIVSGPPPKPLPSYKVDVLGDEIVVAKGDA